MDIVSLLSGFVQQLNDQDCGLCYKLTLGGRSDYFNNQKQSIKDDECEDCCARVGMFEYKSVDFFNSDKNFVSLTHRDYYFTLFIGMPSRPDIQFFDEVDPEKIDESIWMHDLKPIECCVNSVSMNMCEIYDICGCGEHSIELRLWEMKMQINYQDENYNGWMINAIIRESIQ